MPSNSEIIASWKGNSKPDYYSLFIMLFLAFDAWLKQWGAEQGLENGNTRDLINKLKGTNNSLNSRFKSFMDGNSLDDISFRTALKEFASTLESLSLENVKYSESGTFIRYSNAWVGMVGNDKDYKNLTPIIIGQHFIQLDEDHPLSQEDVQFLFKASIEIIYQLRCLLVHGQLEPNEYSGKAIKHAHHLLEKITENI